MIEAAIVHRLRGFCLDVEFRSQGPVLGVFGRSGSGKSTLLSVLAGLVRPQRQELILDGKVLAQRPGGVCLRPEERGVVLVPQDALLFPHLAVRANLCFAKGAAQRLGTERGQRVLEVLRLGSLLERRPLSLSGGECQRVALGRALLAEPSLLLLDEPTSALDRELSREVLALLLEIKRELHVPMVFVTHQSSDLLSLADDCLVLDDGQIVARGLPLDVLARPRATGVAKLVGVDNLLRLQVLRHDPESGVTLLDLGADLALASPLAEARPGDWVGIGLYAEDVILSRERPGRTSARNSLPAEVLSLNRVGHEVLVRVRVGSQELHVRLTPGAVRDLELEAGCAVYVLIKTTACHLLCS